MSISWLLEQSSINQQHIDNFLQCNNLNLPQEIQQVILLHNGACPSNSCFMDADGQEHELGYLLSYHSDDPETVADAYVSLCQEHAQEKLIPLLDDNFGNYICCHSQHQTIHYWLHETNQITALAPSWQHFLAMLY
jgi:SMI1 / KNR4 family (SUKH-1)